MLRIDFATKSFVTDITNNQLLHDLAKEEWELSESVVMFPLKMNENIILGISGGWSINRVSTDITRFDLEDKLHSAWHITSDIDTLISNLDTLTTDETLAILVGLRDLYNCKFDEAVSIMEKLINTGNLT